MPKPLSVGIRTIIGLFAAIVGVGGLLSGDFLTGLGGVTLALLATANPSSFREKWKVSFWLVFGIWILLFLVLSYIDMNSGGSGNAQG